MKLLAQSIYITKDGCQQSRTIGFGPRISKENFAIVQSSFSQSRSSTNSVQFSPSRINESVRPNST